MTRPTLAEIRSWPATVSVEQSALALGCSRSSAYDAIKTGTFPARTIRVGSRIVVATASILALLGSIEPNEVSKVSDDRSWATPEMDWSGATVAGSAKRVNVVHSALIPPGLSEELEAEAAQRGVTPSALICDLVTAGLRS